MQVCPQERCVEVHLEGQSVELYPVEPVVESCGVGHEVSPSTQADHAVRMIRKDVVFPRIQLRRLDELDGEVIDEVLPQACVPERCRPCLGSDGLSGSKEHPGEVHGHDCSGLSGRQEQRYGEHPSEQRTERASHEEQNGEVFHRPFPPRLLHGVSLFRSIRPTCLIRIFSSPIWSCSFDVLRAHGFVLAAAGRDVPTRPQPDPKRSTLLR